MLNKLTIFLSIFFQTLNYYAAGILPYARHNNEIFFLLGSIKSHKNKLSGFGGGKEPYDNENSKITAAREATEELAFIFDSEENFKKILSRYQNDENKFDIGKSQTFSYFLKKLSDQDTLEIADDGFCSYCVEINYNPKFNKKFQKRVGLYRKQLPKCWNETSKLIWVKFEDIDLENLYDPFKTIINSSFQILNKT